MAFDPSKIEDKIDRVVTGSIEVDAAGVQIKRMHDAMEIAKLMSLSYPAVPLFMQNQPGICYAAVTLALRWGMDWFFVASQMYVMENPKTKEQKIGFMAQLVNAVVNARAPLQKKLWGVYDGEGDEMKLTVFGLPKGQTEELTYETPTLGALIKARGKNDYGSVRGSPLYLNDPKQQLWYYGVRAFCRRHFPEVLGGVYDSLDDAYEPVEPRDVTPEKQTLGARLKSQKKIGASRGFDAQHIDRETQPQTGEKIADVVDPVVPQETGPEVAPSVITPTDGAALPAEETK